MTKNEVAEFAEFLNRLIEIPSNEGGSP